MSGFCSALKVACRKGISQIFYLVGLDIKFHALGIEKIQPVKTIVVILRRKAQHLHVFRVTHSAVISSVASSMSSVRIFVVSHSLFSWQSRRASTYACERVSIVCPW